MLHFAMSVIVGVLVLFLSTIAQASEPRVGREAAREYFVSRDVAASSRSASHRLMWIHYGLYTEDKTFYWGQDDRQENKGRGTAGVTYRLGEWTHSMDLLMRVDFSWYSLDGKNPLKMSLMPLITFPDAASGFPLYFGAGAGAGIYFRQIEEESNLSLDYQLLAGLRFFNVLPETGFFIEGGLKNHLHLLSTGQFNGVFVSGGAVFTF